MFWIKFVANLSALKFDEFLGKINEVTLHYIIDYVDESSGLENLVMITNGIILISCLDCLLGSITRTMMQSMVPSTNPLRSWTIWAWIS